VRPEGMVGGQRFLGEHIEGGAGDLAAVERVE
jgi:hypothetical protein